jgi:hypothetical protein
LRRKDGTLTGCVAGVKSSSKFSIVQISFGLTQVGWAHTSFNLAG